MGVDLHRIGTGISSGKSHNGFGNIVSFPAGSFPAAGTYAGTLYGVVYPIVEGGASLTNPVTSADVTTQTCNVDQKHNGSGGVYTDWTTVTNVNFIPAATLFYTDTSAVASQTPVEAPSGSGSYYDSQFSYGYYYHNGSGGYTTEATTWQYFPNNTFIVNDYLPYQIEVPIYSGSYFNNGKYNTLKWNGSGGVTTLTNQGSFISAGTLVQTEPETLEVPSGGTSYNTGRNYRYNHNGSGGYVGAGFIDSYFANGTFITNDGTYDYYWNGTGGYYT